MKTPCVECCIPMTVDSSRRSTIADVLVCIHTGCSRYMQPTVVVFNPESDTWQTDCQLQHQRWSRYQQKGAPVGSEDQLVYALMQRWGQTQSAVQDAFAQAVCG